MGLYVHNVLFKINSFKHTKLKLVLGVFLKYCRLLTSAKVKLNHPYLKGVYQTPCSSGGLYIGETGWSLKTCLFEHQHCSRIDLLSQQWPSIIRIQGIKTLINCNKNP